MIEAMRFRQCSPAAAGFLVNLGMDMDVGARRWPDDDFSLLNLQSFWASRPRDGLKQTQNGQAAPESVLSMYSSPPEYNSSRVLSMEGPRANRTEPGRFSLSFLYSFLCQQPRVYRFRSLGFLTLRNKRVP